MSIDSSQDIDNTCYFTVDKERRILVIPKKTRYRQHLSFDSKRGKARHVTPQYFFRRSFFFEILLIPNYLCVRIIFWSRFGVNILMTSKASPAECGTIITVNESGKEDILFCWRNVVKVVKIRCTILQRIAYFYCLFAFRPFFLDVIWNAEFHLPPLYFLYFFSFPLMSGKHSLRRLHVRTEIYGDALIHVGR